jgi:hypothetical protein
VRERDIQIHGSNDGGRLTNFVMGCKDRERWSLRKKEINFSLLHARLQGWQKPVQSLLVPLTIPGNKSGIRLHRAVHGI